MQDCPTCLGCVRVRLFMFFTRLTATTPKCKRGTVRQARLSEHKPCARGAKRPARLLQTQTHLKQLPLSQRPTLLDHVAPDISHARRPSLMVLLGDERTGRITPDHEESLGRSRTQPANLRLSAISPLPARHHRAMPCPGQRALRGVAAVVAVLAWKQMLLNLDAVVHRLSCLDVLTWHGHEPTRTGPRR